MRGVHRRKRSPLDLAFATGRLFLRAGQLVDVSAIGGSRVVLGDGVADIVCEELVDQGLGEVATPETERRS